MRADRTRARTVRRLASDTAPADLILRNGRIVTPQGVVRGDLAVRGGEITAIGAVPQQAGREIDAQGKWVLPGGVDPHAHIEQMSGMGLMNADTFETATLSAAMGGTTSVISFVAQAAGQRLRDAVGDYAARARRGAMIDHAFHLIVADTTVPEFEDDLAALIAAGHRSIKVFTTYNIRLDDAQILRLMRLARHHGALICVHAENDAIISEARARLIGAGRTSPADHARSRPPMAEIEAVERMIRFAEYTGQPVMLFHISTAGAAEALRQARARGAPVWGETCPHYLLMTEEVLSRPHGAKWMCSPPQRGVADQQALWRALEDGTLDLVSSDHAPYRHDATGKLSAGPQAGFHQIANGMPGLETRLPLMWDAMVNKGHGGVEAFARLTAEAPARLHGLLRKGRLAVGMDADLVIWDETRERTYGEDDLHDNVGYNPWSGQQLRGLPETVILRGDLLVSDGVFHGRPGCGLWQNRQDFWLSKDREDRSAET